LISRALNSHNDIFIKDGRFAVTDEAAEVLQHVRTRLLFYLEEWFLDLNSGTPWFQNIFTRPLDLAEAESIIKSRILNTPGVLKLTSFVFNFDSNTRQGDIVFSAETTYGTIDSEKVYLNV
jgi:hypothetical protein